MVKMKLSSLIRRTMYSDGVTLLPGKVMASIFFIMVLNAMTITTPFSFTPKLVKSFGTSEVDTGYKVGLIACAMFVGRIGFSFIWGYLCDKYGTKKIAIISGVCLATSTLAFSFSFNFPWAVVTRLLQGVSMGLIIISKKLLAEFTDNTNFSLGMSILVGTFSFGIVLGPSLGGFLAFPNELYSQVFSEDSIFAKFPVLLPCGIISIAFYLVIILFWFWVPSSKRVDKYEPFENEENKGKLLKTSENLHLLSNARKDLPGYEIQMTKYEVCSTNASKEVLKTRKFHFTDTTFGKLFRNKACLSGCLLYTLTVTLGMCFEEAYPLFAATTKEYGGFAFTTVDIGISLMIVAMLTLVLQFTLFSRIIEKFGARKTYFCCNIATVVLFPLVPLTQIIHDRAIGVTSTGAIYGWSLTNVKDIAENTDPLGFPLNQYFIFFIFSAFSLVNGLCVLITPKSIDKPIIEEVLSNDASK